MRRNKDEGTWRFQALRELNVEAVRPHDGVIKESVIARLAIDYDAPTLRLHVVEYRHQLVDGPASAPPIAEIEAFANQPRNAVFLIDSRNPPVLQMMPFALHDDLRKVGKKSDAFYASVLMYKRACEERGEAYAYRIASDNGVTPNVVYRWVAEAKRREITIDDDEVGQLRIHGEPMNDRGETMTAGNDLPAQAGAL